MVTQSVIMVQISNRAWTLAALHSACVLARKMSAKVALVEMIPVQHVSWLGTDLGYMNFTDAMRADFVEYQAVVEDYGIECTPVLFQYDSFADAVAQAAEYVGAKMVFAHIPDSRIPFWTKFQLWSLNRQLMSQHCTLIQETGDSAGIFMPAPAVEFRSHQV